LIIKEYNMTVNEAYNTYKNTLLSTAVDKVQIVSLLYEGALKFALNASKFMKENNLEDKADNLNKVSGIILALRDSLDQNADKETVEYLTDLYNFLLKETIKANSHNDTEAFGIVIRYLEQLSNIWNNQVMKK